MVSNDPDFEARAADVIGLYLSPPAHAAVFCVDEKTAIQALDRKDRVLPLPLSPGRAQIQALNRTQPGLPPKRGRAGTVTHDYKRHGTTTLFAALSTLEGSVISMCQPRHRHGEWLKFLRLIDRRTPST